MRKVDPFSASSKTLRTAFLDLFENIRSRKRGIVIASSQRCGTHMTGAYLGAVGIGNPGEHFLDYLNNRTDCFSNSAQLADALNAISSTGSGGLSDAFSVVLMGYTKRIEDDLDALGLSRSLLARSMAHFPWIWLRRDWVEVAISHYFAVSTGHWESNTGQHSAPPFNAEKIRRWWRHIQDVETYWQSYFKTREIHPLELDYAQLVRDPSVLARLIEQAGGDPGLLAAAVPPDRMPLTQIKQEYATRFRDLLAEERSSQLIRAHSLGRRIHERN